jgi:hypothetical protein
MTTADERMVPKILPATRPVEPEDPMSLHATAVFGQPEVMLRCLVQEYAWLGWDADQILGLFQNAFYPVLNDLFRAFGEAGIRERVLDVLNNTGVYHFEETVHGEPDIADGEPELIELGVPASWRSMPSRS